MADKKRLIDCEQAKRATYEEIFWTESEQAVVRNFLAKLPKVDAVEVVHGRWKHKQTNSIFAWHLECSVCCSDYHTPVGYNYCPNCGAKMDKNENP